MARVFRPKAEATEYAPAPGETLDQIVKTKCEVADPPITCDEVSLFNWGTKEKPEVLRALVELVGCRKVEDPADPYNKCELDPTKGLKGKVLLPKVWKKAGLPYEKVHKLKVKEQLPATAISITKLDPWFLPGEEACDIAYTLEGIKPRAQKVAFDAYASNYAKATATNDGEFVKYTYAPLLDEKIVKRSVSADAAERSSGDVPEWKGESEATIGILHKRTGKARFINAASAPYTVNLLYYKTDGQNPPTTSPLVRIESFWVRWSGTGGTRAVVADSLKIKWTGKNLPGGLQGQLQVWDKDGIVWRQHIPTAKCGNGDQTIDWTADGTPIVKEDKMPYRVQIQLHTDKDTAPGFAVAAMHTDVRVFMHKDIGTFADNHEQEPQVLKFALAPHFAGTAPAEDSGKGRKLRLARGGYHPGPVNDDETDATYLKAVKEIQRDSQQPGVTPKVRIKADGALGADTKAVIAALNPGHRPLFATANRSNLTADDAINTALNDKATEMIAWVDDRHSFTKPDQLTSETASMPYVGVNMWLEDYRGKFSGTDVKAAKDATSICRPFLPIETAIPLLRKANKLIDTTVPVVNDASRAATGPIRLDWTFRDLPWKDNVNATFVTPSRTRPRKYLAKTFDAKKGAHNGKDAHNCPTAQGGIRGGAYYQAPLGVDATSLTPWRALGDGGPKAVCSVVHDDLEQEEARVYATHLGKAGVYLNPSIIGGDGYQFRGQVSFADLPGAPTHPNWKTLRDRYDLTKLPQAHTAPIRLWRKDTWKGYIPWAPPSGQTWGTATAAVNTPYEPGFVHFEHEGGASHTVTLATLLPGPGGPTDYRNLIAATTGPKGNNFKTDTYRAAAEIQLDPNNVWPWSSARHLGIQAVPAPGVTLATYDNAFLYSIIWNDSWRSFRGPLLHFLLTKIEASQSLMRGHLICEFVASPQYWKEKYYCSVCNTGEILIETTAGGGSGVGEGCRSGVCAGVLQSSIKANYRCDTCPRVVNGVSISKGLDNSVCADRCTGNSQQVTSPLNWLSLKFGRTASVKTEYKCARCSRVREVVELENQVGTHQQVCNVVCAGRLHEVPGSRTAQEIQGPSTQLNLPSAGEALGVLMCGSAMGPFSFWAHEVAHHKHFEHAGDVIQVPAQHDRAANTVDATVQADTRVNAQKWDRACIMSYVSVETGLDMAYFCGKCVLKMRGWIVESGIADPAGGEAGP